MKRSTGREEKNGTHYCQFIPNSSAALDGMLKERVALLKRTKERQTTVFGHVLLQKFLLSAYNIGIMKSIGIRDSIKLDWYPCHPEVS